MLVSWGQQKAAIDGARVGVSGRAAFIDLEILEDDISSSIPLSVTVSKTCRPRGPSSASFALWV
jgi:hypothetical protein